MDKLPIPAPDAPPEQWGHVWDRLGRPPTPDGYKVPEKLPDGVKVDEQAVKGFFSEAHRLGLTSQQAAALVRWQAENHTQQASAAAAEQGIRAEKVVADLRREWGSAFDQNIGLAREAVKRFGGDEALAYLNTSGMGNDPTLIRLMSKVGKAIAADEVIGAGGRTKFAPTPDEARREIARLYTDQEFLKGYMDNMHPSHKAAVEQMRQLQLAAAT